MADDPTCIFACDAALVLAVERALGPPIDSYVSGWQVWIDDPTAFEGDIELEWRLHPPADFSQADGLSHHDLWDEVLRQLADGAGELRLGAERRQLDEVWVLLEVYPAFGELTPAELRAVAEDVLGRRAEAAGEVDHGWLGGRWKATDGDFDLPAALCEDLGVTPWW